ncbi:hypothetical protein BGX27_008469 [Mortierella sp. AM989]|nr:hypothetical protein BGX27_008469 [Mortierella sp. AM989]
MTSSPSTSSWKTCHSSSFGNGLNDDHDLDENGLDEQERLLARRRSTSYYDANRSRAPVAVVIKNDSSGRPISTWSTASSVAAQRGEELSQWSKRRDDLIKIYGRSNLNSGSFANYDDLEEVPEQEREQEDEEVQEQSQGREHDEGQSPNLNQGQWREPGAGAGGSSTAYYLNNYLQPPQHSYKYQHSITIFDQSDRIGGRCSVFPVQNPGREDKYVEMGASIFVKVNYNLVDAAKEFGLKIKPLDGEMLAIWNGKEFIFEESKWRYWSIFKGLRRWGLAPIKLRRLLKATVNDLLQSYQSPEAFHSISEFAQRFKLNKAASAFSHHFLQSNGISDLYGAEVVEVATRVNYGSNLHEIHALGALVTMAADDALQIEGGNFQIFEGMVARSKANVKLNTKIARVRRLEPAYEGAESRFEITTTAGQKEIFDTIVIAAPIQSTNIKFDFDMPPVPEVKYRAIYATFVRGHVNPAYFHATSAENFPAHILTTNSDAEFTSLSIQTKLSNGETVTKIFSPKPIQKELLDRLYSNRTWVKSKTWKAYPHLEPLPSDVDSDLLSDINGKEQQEQVVLKKESEANWGKVEVVPGVFYLNAFEPLISTMETETIAGKNVARLVRDRILGYCPVEKLKP